jgi:hemerythrin HHE cation binding domain-containing protein
MASQMSMNRVIHQALRRTLDRFSGALASFPDGDAARARELATAWQFFYAQFTVHHTGEHAIAWPALREVGVSGELLDQLDAEHDKIAAGLSAAGQAISTLVAAPTSASAEAAHDRIKELSAVAADHLVHEEAELESVYWDKRDTPQIKEMGRKFGRDVGISEAGSFFAWLQDGATPEENAALRANVPAPVVMMLTAVRGGKYRRTIAPVWQAG